MAVDPHSTQATDQFKYESEIRPLSLGLIRRLVAIVLLVNSLPGVIASLGTHVIFSVAYKAVFFGDAQVFAVTVVEVLCFALGLLLLFNRTAKRFFRILLSRNYLRPST